MKRLQIKGARLLGNAATMEGRPKEKKGMCTMSGWTLYEAVEDGDIPIIPRAMFP